jgi:hypothetical protein
LADLRICDQSNVCYLAATLTTPDDPTGMCFDGNCFVATLDSRNFQVASFGSYTPLVIQ